MKITAFSLISLNFFYGCFFAGKLYGADEAPPSPTRTIPHYPITYNCAQGFQGIHTRKPITLTHSMNAFLRSVTASTELDAYFKYLLDGCEVKSLARITSSSYLYFVGKIGNASAHWVIKHSNPNEDWEVSDTNKALALLKEKKPLANFSLKTFKLVLPECSFEIQTRCHALHCLLFHREKSHDLYRLLSSRGIQNAPNAFLEHYETARDLGRLLFKIHEDLRPSRQTLKDELDKQRQEELEAAVTYGKIDALRLFCSSADTELHKFPANEGSGCRSGNYTLKPDSLLARYALTKCLGDFHLGNVMLRKVGGALRYSLIDYASLARETKPEACSLFTNDLSYFMFCLINFFGYRNIKTMLEAPDEPERPGERFLGSFLAGYFESIPSTFREGILPREEMLSMVKDGFCFFIDQLTSIPELSPSDANPISGEFSFTVAERITSSLNGLIRHEHGITRESTPARVAETIAYFKEAKARLKTRVIDLILNETRKRLAPIAPKTREEAIAKLREARLKLKSPSSIPARHQRIKIVRETPHDQSTGVKNLFAIAGDVPPGDMAELFETFGEHFFNFHREMIPFSISGHETQKIVSRPITPEISGYLIVRNLEITPENVFLRKGERAMVKSDMLTSAPVKIAGLARIMASFMSESLTLAPTSISCLSAFLNGYLKTIPEHIAREHVLPDIKVAFLRDMARTRGNAPEAVQSARETFEKIRERTLFSASA